MSLLRVCPFLFFEEKETTSKSQWMHPGVIEEFRTGLAQVCKGTGGAEVEGSSCPRENLEGVQGSGVSYGCAQLLQVGLTRALVSLSLLPRQPQTFYPPTSYVPLELVIPY